MKIIIKGEAKEIAELVTAITKSADNKKVFLARKPYSDEFVIVSEAGKAPTLFQKR